MRIVQVTVRAHTQNYFRADSAGFFNRAKRRICLEDVIRSNLRTCCSGSRRDSCSCHRGSAGSIMLLLMRFLLVPLALVCMR